MDFDSSIAFDVHPARQCLPTSRLTRSRVLDRLGALCIAVTRPVIWPWLGRLLAGALAKIWPRAPLEPQKTRTRLLWIDARYNGGRYSRFARCPTRRLVEKKLPLHRHGRHAFCQALASRRGSPRAPGFDRVWRSPLPSWLVVGLPAGARSCTQGVRVSPERRPFGSQPPRLKPFGLNIAQ